MDNKHEYEAPSVRLIGSVGDITQSNVSGTKTDEAFPAGTPFSDLTFS